MICIDNVTIKNIGNAMYKPSIYIWIIVYTCLSHVYTEYKYLFLYMQSENMYKTCLYHVYTWIYQPKQVHTCYKQPKARYLHVLHAIKKSIITGLEPSTLCIPASCLNHYATSVHAGMQHLQYIYAFCRTSGAEPAPPPPPPTSHQTL